MNFKNKTGHFGKDDINFNDINEEYLREMEKNSKIFEEKMKKLNHFQNEINFNFNQNFYNNNENINKKSNFTNENIYESNNKDNLKRYEEENTNNNYNSTFNPNLKNFVKEERFQINSSNNNLINEELNNNNNNFENNNNNNNINRRIEQLENEISYKDSLINELREQLTQRKEKWII